METTTEMAALPDDALANVFRRLPPRSLAVGRGVCKAWRATVDARALLLQHRELLPHHVHGVLINYIDHCRPHLFARPSVAAAARSGREVDGVLSFLPIDNHRDWWSVLDHCRGLVLCDIRRGGQLCVCNPATRRWTLVPPRQLVGGIWRYHTSAYLAFDPAISVQYEIVMIPIEPEKPWQEPPSPEKKRSERRALEVGLHGVDDTPFCLDDWLQSLWNLAEDEEEEEFRRQQRQLPSVEEDMTEEWPPTPWTLEVFSSSAGRWEQRAFVRHGDPVATVQDMRLDQPEPTWRGPRQRYAAYWKGALYVHCRGSFITRFSMLNHNYQVIKIPEDIKDTSAKPYLGISEKGVYFGVVQYCQLQVWILNESCTQMEWVLKCDDDLTHYAQHVRKYGAQMNAPWIVHDVYDTDNNASEAVSEERFEWDSDDDDIFTIQDGSTEEHYGSFDILGFHPYKEVVFLADYFRVVAYHLNTSKVQYLGNSRPNSYYRNYTNDIYESFVYTPCMIGELNKDSTMKEN